MKPTFYLSDKDNDRMHQIAEKLRKKNIQGLYKSNGELNRSAFLRISMDIVEKVLKTSENK